MEFENLLTLMNTMSESNLTEFLYEEKEVKILFSKLKTSVISGVNEKKSGQETETAPAMGLGKIYHCQIFKHQYRKRYQKNKFVHFTGKFFINPT